MTSIQFSSKFSVRHTDVTLRLGKLEVNSERLGHGSVAMILDVYAHASPGYSKLRPMDSTRYSGLLAIDLKSKRCPECENGPAHLVR